MTGLAAAQQHLQTLAHSIWTPIWLEGDDDDE